MVEYIFGLGQDITRFRIGAFLGYRPMAVGISRGFRSIHVVGMCFLFLSWPPNGPGLCYLYC